MKLQAAVKQETARIALGTACLCCLMMLVFLLIGRFDHTVVLGTLLGYATAVGNFFLMALTIQHVTENMKPIPPAPDAQAADGQEDEDKPAPSALSREDRQRIQLSYTGRMLLIVAVGVTALLVDIFHPVATLLCLLFPRIVIFLLGILDKNKEKEA